MKNISHIVIDPQNGFCSPFGSLGIEYGMSELHEIRKTIPKIVNALTESRRSHLVKSEYYIGQFTERSVSHGLSYLCVPTVNNDSDVIIELSSVEFHSVTTKHEQNALSSDFFFSEIERDLKSGIRRFVISGFLLEHCVKETAEALFEKLQNSGVDIYVCSDLTASRTRKYENGIVTSTFSELEDKGIKIKTWAEID